MILEIIAVLLQILITMTNVIMKTQVKRDIENNSNHDSKNNDDKHYS